MTVKDWRKPWEFYKETWNLTGEKEQISKSKRQGRMSETAEFGQM